MPTLSIDETLLDCVIRGTIEGLAMTQVTPDPAGAARLIASPREVSVLVGIHGRRSGSLTLNLSRRTAGYLAARLLGSDEAESEEVVFDAVCELGNMVAGRFKEILQGTPYAFDAITLPSLVFGADYRLYLARGLLVATVEFEIAEIPMVHFTDRYFSTSICLLRS